MKIKRYYTSAAHLAEISTIEDTDDTTTILASGKAVLIGRTWSKTILEPRLG
jgi:hypothetical protein